MKKIIIPIACIVINCQINAAAPIVESNPTEQNQAEVMMSMITQDDAFDVAWLAVEYFKAEPHQGAIESKSNLLKRVINSLHEKYPNDTDLVLLGDKLKMTTNTPFYGVDDSKILNLNHDDLYHVLCFAIESLSQKDSAANEDLKASKINVLERFISNAASQVPDDEDFPSLLRRLQSLK